VGSDLGEGHKLRQAHLCLVKALLEKRCFHRRYGVRGRLADAQVIVLKDLEAAFSLRLVMFAFGTLAHR
jgi:hypothetical protein